MSRLDSIFYLNLVKRYLWQNPLVSHTWKHRGKSSAGPEPAKRSIHGRCHWNLMVLSCAVDRWSWPTGCLPQPTAFTSFNSKIVFLCWKCIFRFSTFVVTAGGVDLTTPETGEMSLTSTKAFVHEIYISTTDVNDIPLIQLPKAFP